MDKRAEFSTLTREFMEGRLSRRRFLQASALLGLSGVASAIALA